MTTDILCGQTKHHEQRAIRNELNLVFCTNYFSSRFGDPLVSSRGGRSTRFACAAPRSNLVYRGHRVTGCSTTVQRNGRANQNHRHCFIYQLFFTKFSGKLIFVFNGFATLILSCSRVPIYFL